MNQVIDKLKKELRDLAKENEELEIQVTLKWTLQSIKDLLEGDITMMKWDLFNTILQDHSLQDLLKPVYS